MQPNKLFNLLGLAQRAGKLISGEELVLRNVRKRTALLVICAVDASSRTKKTFKDKCSSYKVSYIEYGTRQELGAAIGKFERVLLALLCPNFAEKVKKLANDNDVGGG